jgi:hypothetical protein
MKESSHRDPKIVSRGTACRAHCGAAQIASTCNSFVTSASRRVFSEVLGGWKTFRPTPGHFSEIFREGTASAVPTSSETSRVLAREVALLVGRGAVRRNRRKFCLARTARPIALSFAFKNSCHSPLFPAFLIDTGCQLETAVTHSKQREAAHSNRRWIRGFQIRFSPFRFLRLRSLLWLVTRLPRRSAAKVGHCRQIM